MYILGLGKDTTKSLELPKRLSHNFFQCKIEFENGFVFFNIFIRGLLTLQTHRLGPP